MEGDNTCEPVSPMKCGDRGHMNGRPSSSSQPQCVCMWAALGRRKGSGPVEDLGDLCLVAQ